MLFFPIIIILIFTSSAYQHKGSHFYPDEYTLTSIALAPGNITNKNGDTVNMVFGTKSGHMIFTNAFNSSVRFIYNSPAFTEIRYVGWNKGGIISMAIRTVVILDPVTLERISYISLGSYGDIVSVSHVYREKEKVVLLAIQCQDYYGNKIYLYENQLRIMELNKNVIIAPAEFDVDGNYFYYFDNEQKKKFTVDIVNRKVLKQQYFLGKHKSLAMSTRKSSQTAVTLSQKGDIFIWQNDAANKYTVISPPKPQSLLAFTTHSSQLITYEQGGTLTAWKTSFTNYQNWNIIQQIQVGKISKMVVGQGLVVLLEGRNKVNVYYKYEEIVDKEEASLVLVLVMICLCGWACLCKRYRQAKRIKQQKYQIQVISTTNIQSVNKDQPYPLNEQTVEENRSQINKNQRKQPEAQINK